MLELTAWHFDCEYLTDNNSIDLKILFIMNIENLSQLTDTVREELLSVWEKSVRSSHHFLTEDDISYFRPLVRDQYLPAVRVSVIRDENGSIAAFMGLSDDMLKMLFVLPERQGHGYGKALVKHAVNVCGIRKVDVNEDNAQARGFYLAMGYQVISHDEYDPTGKPFPILHLQI